MNITFVAKRNRAYDYERWKIFKFKDKEDNPFYKYAPDKEIIDSELIAHYLSQPHAQRSGPGRELYHFLLDAAIDGFADIRYYYS
jgi:hypothetical protein